MSGKLCPVHDVRLSKAYCEGRLAAKNGEILDTNPHPADTPASYYWSTGYATWLNNPDLGNDQGRDCCGGGLPFGGGFGGAFITSEFGE